MTPSVVEEFLRYWAPVQPARRAVVDTEVGGVQFKEGDQLLVLLGAANLDDREFPAACEFQPERHPNRHLAFGTSIHRCLGSHIARIELRVMLDELLRRLPDFELQDDAEAEWSKGQVQGVVRVPIQFPPGKRESAERLARGSGGVPDDRRQDPLEPETRTTPWAYTRVPRISTSTWVRSSPWPSRPKA